MPWKINGEKWHLSEKGFPPGKAAKWDRAFSAGGDKLSAKWDPKLEVKWDTRDAIVFIDTTTDRYGRGGELRTEIAWSAGSSANPGP